APGRRAGPPPRLPPRGPGPARPVAAPRAGRASGGLPARDDRADPPTGVGGAGDPCSGPRGRKGGPGRPHRRRSGAGRRPAPPLRRADRRHAAPARRRRGGRPGGRAARAPAADRTDPGPQGGPVSVATRHASGQRTSLFGHPKAVYAVAFACVISFMGIGLVDPILPALSSQLDATPSQTTLLFTSYLVVT